VDSSFMLLTPRDAPLVPPENRPNLERMLRVAFGMRRKTLANNLQISCGMGKAEAASLLADNGLAQDVRGEALSPETLYTLSIAPKFVKKISTKQEK
jgi:16S rRNA A1518/A1519 N6-dimethyltransferase RsmA/KsgA/DIM1 with predicted DNA glycosylase/AP lyase activity